MKKSIKITIGGIIALLLLGGFYGYLQYEKRYPATDDAYVQANVINMAAQVSGPIIAMNTENNAVVKKGQWLIKIDPKPFQIAVKQAQANLDTVQQQVKSAQEAIHTAKAQIAQKQAQLVLTKKKTKRTLTLVKDKSYPKQSGDEAVSQLKVAKAALAAANDQLQQAQGDLGAAKAKVKVAKSELEQAELNLAHTVIYAPASGKITQFDLRIGDMITAQQQLFALIDTSEWWVQANFKETDLKRIEPGQPATITIDMYPGVTFKGKVQSVSAGSGSAFSLLPAENATGNWVKVTQRFSVRVSIINPSENPPLRVGASATVRINTTDNTDSSYANA